MREDASDARPVFDALFKAKSLAIIGASNDPESLSGRPLGFLAAAGYKGSLYPVNPTHAEVQGHRAYPTIGDVPETVDAAMVAVRASLVPQVLRECVAAGVRTAVVVSSGFGEGQGAGDDLRTEVKEILAGSSLRVVGPNCEGVLSAPNNMPFTFSPVADLGRTGLPLKAGPAAVISQSGGVGFAVAQWGTAVGLGFNYVVTTGNEIDVDALDLAEHIIRHTESRVLLLLIEGFEHAERLKTIASRAREANTQIVVAKLGRSGVGRRAARAHTQHDAGEAALYDTLFARDGVTVARDEEELMDTAMAYSRSPLIRGRRLAIVTTSGGAGVWLADACQALGFEIPELSATIQKRLAENMPAYGSPTNPVDLTAQFFAGGAFAPVTELLFESDEVDAVVIVTSLALPGRLERERDGFRAVRERYPDGPLLFFSYTRPAQPCIDALEELGLPWFASSARTARALATLATAGGVELKSN